LPTAQIISERGGIDDFGNHSNILIKQTRKGCIRNLLGCIAQTEARVATMQDQDIDRFYILEESHWFCRIFFECIHPFSMKLSVGGDIGGPVIGQFERPLACASNPWKCCCFQQITAIDYSTQQVVGKTEETFWICGPQFNVFNESGAHQYKIHIPVCCFILPNVCKEGLCSCRVPFYIYPPNAGVDDEHVGRIVKVWAGWGNAFIGVHQFQVEFPEKSDASTKLTLLGSALLINELYFKRDANYKAINQIENQKKV